MTVGVTVLVMLTLGVTVWVMVSTVRWLVVGHLGAD